VTAKYFLVDYCRYRKAVKAVSEMLPQLDVVPSFALVVEAVDTIDACTLMISPQQEEVLRIFHLQGLFKISKGLGVITLYASNRQMVSRDCFPLST
jgi:hypothetical protein